MNRVTALLLCFCIAIPAAFGACPAQAPLTALGLGTVNTGAAIAVIASPAFCARLSTVTSCCDNTAVVAKFQSTSDTISNNIADAAGKRDIALLDARKNLRFLDRNYSALFTALNNTKTKIEAWIADANADATVKANAAIVKKFYTDYFDFYDKVFTGYNGIQKSFDDYQTNRKTCFDKLLSFAANAKCYACGSDSDADIGGTATAPTVASDSSIKSALLSACWNYVNGSDYQNNIFQLNPYNTSLTALTSAAIDIANGTTSALTTFISKLTEVKTASKTYPAGIVPATACTSTSCDWITDNFFSNGMFGLTADNIAVLIRGGDLYTYINSRRVLSGSESRSRNLAFTSATAPSGVTPAFPSNPGKVTNSVDPLGSSAFRVGVISSIVALFVAFLF